MLRWAFRILTLVSTVLLLTVSLLALPSFWIPHNFFVQAGRHADDRPIDVWCLRGRVMVMWNSVSFEGSMLDDWALETRMIGAGYEDLLWTEHAVGASMRMNFLAARYFAWGDDDYSRMSHDRMLVVSLWAPIVLFAVAPVWWLIAYWRRWRGVWRTLNRATNRRAGWTRRLLGIFAHCAVAVSLVLTYSTLLSWAKSFWIVDTYSLRQPAQFIGSSEPGLGIHAKDGRFVVRVDDTYDRDDLRSDFFSDSSNRRIPSNYSVERHRQFATSGWVGFGFAYLRHADRDYAFTVIVIPHWMALVVFSWPFLLWLWFFLRRFRMVRRVSVGRCYKCGYDLRGSDGDQCSECGAARVAVE